MNKGKVYELNGAEQAILESNCHDLREITRKKVYRQDAIKTYTTDIALLGEQSRDIIGDMAKRFGLTRVQVIHKVLAENRRAK